MLERCSHDYLWHSYIAYLRRAHPTLSVCRGMSCLIHARPRRQSGPGAETVLLPSAGQIGSQDARGDRRAFPSCIGGTGEVLDGWGQGDHNWPAKGKNMPMGNHRPRCYSLPSDVGYKLPDIIVINPWSDPVISFDDLRQAWCQLYWGVGGGHVC